jgi:hypothetical protein
MILDRVESAAPRARRARPRADGGIQPHRHRDRTGPDDGRP